MTKLVGRLAPSLVPRKPGDRVKTNRRDALSLARLLRAGELTAVWAPDERHEAMRDLVRARAAGAFDRRVKRQQAGAFLLGLGRVYPGKKTWGGAHRKWLASQAFAHLEQRIAFEELIRAMDEAKARVARLEKAIEEAVADWSLAPTVMGLMAMRGIDLVAATTILAELGDLGLHGVSRRDCAPTATARDRMKPLAKHAPKLRRERHEPQPTASPARSGRRRAGYTRAIPSSPRPTSRRTRIARLACVAQNAFWCIGLVRLASNIGRCPPL